MPFLSTSIRNALRTYHRVAPAILRQQRVSPFNPLRPQAMLARRYSQQPPGSNTPPTPQNSSSDSQSNDPTKGYPDSPAKDDAVPPESKSNQDPFSGDLSAAPGSLLAQYTTPAEEGKEVEPSSGLSGQLPKREEYKSSSDRKRERFARFFLYGFLTSVVGGTVWLGRPLEEEERQRLDWGNLPTGHSPWAYWQRYKKRGKFMLDYFNEPAFPKLLPPPAPEPYRRPYTLLLDLDDLLVHSEWTREHGWRTAKRPGLDYFLGYLTQYYEIVIFTNQYSATAYPLIGQLDKYHTWLSFALFRESTRFIDGKVVKDLSYLNRDLDKVILLDTNAASCSLQPENCLLLDKWKGSVDDKELVALIPFLEFLASQNFEDIRPLLTEYKQVSERRKVSIPEEFARREAMARAALQRTLKPVPTTDAGSSFVSRLFGLRTLPPVQTPTTEPGDVVFPLDLMRAQAAEGYENMKKYFDEHGQEVLDEDKKREQQALAEQKSSLMGFFNRLMSGGVAPPPTATTDEKTDKKPNDETSSK